jgi:outer membrane receptor protein involved in Fe transport
MRLRKILLIGVSAGTGLLLSWGWGSALAQDANTQASSDVETVTVTGSRIPSTILNSPNPIQTVTDVDIKNSGYLNLTDYLERIPALVGSLGDLQTAGLNTGQTDAGSSLSGLNLLDLRNLGFDRTLVLEDGQRLVSSSTGDAGVDVNSIPITLIDSVDVETGGASAIYGADGVTGVVNFKMKHDLEGVSARAQADVTQDGGGNKYFTAASIGHNFDDDKGNVTLTFEGSYQDRFSYTQRDFTKTGGAQYFVPNPNNKDGTIPTLPQNILVKNGTIYAVAANGVIDLEDLGGANNYSGSGAIYNTGTEINGEFAEGGDGLPLAPAFTADFAPVEHRDLAEISAKEDFSKWFKLSGEFRFSHVDTKSASEPFFTEFGTIASDDPFLPSNVAAAMNDPINNPYYTGYALFGSYPYLTPGLVMSERVSRDVYRGVLGVEGDLPAPDFVHDAQYHVNYVYGQTDIADTIENNTAIDRYFAALDSVQGPNGPTCRSNLDPSATPVSLEGDIFDGVTGLPTSLFGTTFTPGANSGCVAYNPFVTNSAQDKAATKWITFNTTTNGFISQQDLNGYASFNFPQAKEIGMADAISVVLGGEWRQEVSKSASDPITRQMPVPGEPGTTASLFFDSGSPVVEGRFHVSEGFGEVNFPILADQPFAEELTVHAAGRVSDYSTAGTDKTWSIDGVYSPISGLKFRGTDAVAVRAPNIGELFAPLVQGFQGIDDPCDPEYINQGTGYRSANCQALENALLGPGVYTAGMTPVQQSVTLPTFIGGNTKLAPETARTLTLGTVIQPDFLPDFVFTADWYQVHISDAITSLSAQTIVDQCVDLSTINNPYCAAVTRNGNGTQLPGSVKQVIAQELNVSLFSTAGVDFTAAYHAELNDWFSGGDYGSLDVKLLGSRLLQYKTTELAGQAPVNGINTYSGPTPYWQLNLDLVWKLDAWTVDYNVDWYDSVLNDDRQTIDSQPNIFPAKYIHIPAHDNQSIQVAYDVAPGWDVYAGINNLWYQKPFADDYGEGEPESPLGRVFYAGLKVDDNPF